MLRRYLGAAAVFACALLAFGMAGGTAWAGLGQPTDGELGLQLPATPIMESIHSLYNTVNGIIIAITVFVLILMLYVMFRFKESSNPVPSRTTHNTMLEVAWTIIPIMILVGIAVPSFRLLYDQY